MTRPPPVVVRRRLHQLAIYWVVSGAVFYLVVVRWHPDMRLALAVLLGAILLAGVVLVRRFPRWPPRATRGRRTR